MDGGKFMNTLYLALTIVGLFITIFLNKSGQREIGLVAAGFTGGFAFLAAFEDTGYPLPLIFVGGFIATVFFEYIRFKPRLRGD